MPGAFLLIALSLRLHEVQRLAWIRSECSLSVWGCLIGREPKLRLLCSFHWPLRVFAVCPSCLLECCCINSKGTRWKHSTKGRVCHNSPCSASSSAKQAAYCLPVKNCFLQNLEELGHLFSLKNIKSVLVKLTMTCEAHNGSQGNKRHLEPWNCSEENN